MRKRKARQKKDRVENFFLGCDCWDRQDFEIDRIRECVQVISEGRISIPEYIYLQERREMQLLRIYEYLLVELDESGCSANLDDTMKTEDLVFAINRVLEVKQLPLCRLTEESVLAFDDAKTEALRLDGASTMEHDIFVVRQMIEKQGHMLVNLLGYTYCLTIVTQEEYKRLQVLEVYG